MLVGLNEKGMVHDFYYPYVGLDNLTTSRSSHHKVGIWVNGKFSWLDGDGWDIKVDFEADALVSDITATNSELGVELHFNDFVDDRYTAFCRYIEVKNLSDTKADVRLFMHQVFQISRAGRGDTALFVPENNYLLDYKGWCSILLYAEDQDKKPFDQFAVGNYGIEGKLGTFVDAEDGELSGNLVEHGGVDSVMRCSFSLEPKATNKVSYWAIASDSQFHADIVHHLFRQKGLPKRLDRTRNAWGQWLSVGRDKIAQIDPKYQVMAKKSLLVTKSHIDRHGGIIASCDSSIYNYGRDYYSYVWPRDGALTMLPLIELGYKDEPRKFFEFCADTMHPAGYMMHKYQPDKAVGSTWHPLLHQDHRELAIQEDETASVIYALGKYWQKSEDDEFIENLYPHFVKPAANFMARFIDAATGLPHASYDLWEEKFATHTYTVAFTMAALRVAASMADKFGSPSDSQNWRAVADKVAKNFEVLFKPDEAYYRKSFLLQTDKSLSFDDNLDSSSAYGVMLAGDQSHQEAVSKTYEAIEKRLFNSSPAGGVPRYEHDNYFLTNQNYTGNPWIICTLWLAQYYIKQNRRDEATALIDWVISHANPSGMLAEQIDPQDGGPVGVLPLIWSHSTLVETLLML
jgi:GH15 family glucan-1,4-alpha-glucosidase